MRSELSLCDMNCDKSHELCFAHELFASEHELANAMKNSASQMRSAETGMRNNASHHKLFILIHFPPFGYAQGKLPLTKTSFRVSGFFATFCREPRQAVEKTILDLIYVCLFFLLLFLFSKEKVEMKSRIKKGKKK